MNKYAYFHTYRANDWPSLDFLRPYFLSPPAPHGWFHNSGNDSGGLSLEGVDGTDHLPRLKGRKDIELAMWGNPDLGVLLQYSLVGGGVPRRDWFSKGDMSKLREWVRTLHDTPMPVGLYIPFAKAWPAVKEFMQTEGQLPASIEWIKSSDLPEGTFPDP